jgi:hypothetical protein
MPTHPPLRLGPEGDSDSTPVRCGCTSPVRGARPVEPVGSVHAVGSVVYEPALRAAVGTDNVVTTPTGRMFPVAVDSEMRAHVKVL